MLAVSISHMQRVISPLSIHNQEINYSQRKFNVYKFQTLRSNADSLNWHAKQYITLATIKFISQLVSTVLSGREIERERVGVVNSGDSIYSHRCVYVCGIRDVVITIALLDNNVPRDCLFFSFSFFFLFSPLFSLSFFFFFTVFFV